METDGDRDVETEGLTLGLALTETEGVDETEALFELEGVALIETEGVELTDAETETDGDAPKFRIINSPVSWNKAKAFS